MPKFTAYKLVISKACELTLFSLLFIIGSLLFFSSAQAQQVDLSQYIAPDSDYQAHISSGETFHTYQVSDNTYKQCKNDDCSSFQMIFTTPDGFAIQGENYWEGPNTTFQYRQGNFDPLNTNLNQHPQASWIGDNMQVGDTYDAGPVTVVGFRLDGSGNTTGVFDAAHDGYGGNLITRLNFVGPYNFGNGVVLDNVAIIEVVSGPGTGEKFYFVKDVGWVGWNNNIIDQPIEGFTGTLPSITPLPGKSCYQCKCVWNNLENCSIVGVDSPEKCTPEVCANANNPGTGWCENKGGGLGDITTAPPVEYPGCKNSCTPACVNDGSNQAECIEDGDATYNDVQARSLTNDSQLTDVFTRVLLPDVLGQTISQIIQQADTNDPLLSTMSIQRNFFSVWDCEWNWNPVTMVNDCLRKILCAAPIFRDGVFCRQYLALGGSRQTTNQLRFQSLSLAKSNFPDSTLSPKKKDCRIKVDSLGNIKTNDVSKGLSPIYTQDIPDLKDFQSKVLERAQSTNLNIQGEILKHDERVPYLDQGGDINDQKNYPPGVHPLPE